VVALGRIRFPALSITAAEAALASFHFRLAEHDLPAPKLNVVFKKNGTVQVSLVRADAKHIELALQSWAEQVK
jgi:hypothetical protein